MDEYSVLGRASYACAHLQPSFGSDIHSQSQRFGKLHEAPAGYSRECERMK